MEQSLHPPLAGAELQHSGVREALLETLSAVRGSLHFTEVVLWEACLHLGGNTQLVHALLGLVRMGAIQLLHPRPTHLERTQE